MLARRASIPAAEEAVGLRRRRITGPHGLRNDVDLRNVAMAAHGHDPFHLGRVLFPEPDDLPPTEAHKQTASSDKAPKRFSQLVPRWLSAYLRL